jgi:hypothetical protein
MKPLDPTKIVGFADQIGLGFAVALPAMAGHNLNDAAGIAEALQALDQVYTVLRNNPRDLTAAAVVNGIMAGLNRHRLGEFS